MANFVVFLIASAQCGAFSFASRYLQGVLGHSPVRTGLAFAPFSAGIVVGTAVAARLFRRFGPRLPLVTGLALAAVGLGWFGLLGSDGTFLGDFLGLSLVAGVGFGVCLVANTTAGTAGIPRTRRGWPAACSTPAAGAAGASGWPCW